MVAPGILGPRVRASLKSHLRSSLPRSDPGDPQGLLGEAEGEGKLVPWGVDIGQWEEQGGDILATPSGSLSAVRLCPTWLSAVRICFPSFLVHLSFPHSCSLEVLAQMFDLGSDF